MADHVLASATLVDFPQFPAIHHLIPRVLDLRLNLTTERDYPQIEDSEKWDIYLRYRQIVSRFLTDQTRSLIAVNRTPVGPCTPYRHLPSFVGQKHYVGFAKYLLRLLIEMLR